MNGFEVEGGKGFLSLMVIVLLLSFGCTTVHETTIAQEVPRSASGNNSIFFDEFDPSNGVLRNAWRSNGKAYWVWQGDTEHRLAGCENGCLKQNVESIRALNAIMYVTTPQFSNGTIEVKTRIKYDTSANPTNEELTNIRQSIGSGIVFRMKDENNYYMFRLAGEDGAVLGKMVNNEWTDLANPRRFDFLEGGRVMPNNWYRLKVKVYASTIQCYINDSPIINIADPDTSFTVGYFGVCTFKCFADFEFIDARE